MVKGSVGGHLEGVWIIKVRFTFKTNCIITIFNKVGDHYMYSKVNG